jgi:small subunit ribosomal protein S7
MPRKGPAPRRDLVSDPIYHSVVVTQLVNKVMLHGKRSLAEHIVYEAMEIMATKSGDDALAMVKRPSTTSSRPSRSRAAGVGGATYQVPVEVGRAARRRWRSAGSSTSPGPVARRRWPSASPPS